MLRAFSTIGFVSVKAAAWVCFSFGTVRCIFAVLLAVTTSARLRACVLLECRLSAAGLG